MTIHRLIILAYDYPTLTLEIDCGSGTYVRAIGRDLAESLGTAAVMSELERTAIGSFRVEETCNPGMLTAESLRQNLVSPLRAIPSMPVVQFSDAEVQLVINGLCVPSVARNVTSAPVGQQFAAVDTAGELISIVRRREDGGLAPVLNFRKADSANSS